MLMQNEKLRKECFFILNCCLYYLSKVCQQTQDNLSILELYIGI